MAIAEHIRRDPVYPAMSGTSCLYLRRMGGVGSLTRETT